MNDVDTEPLRSYKVLGFTDGAKSHQRRRRPAGKPGTPPSPARRTQSFSQDFGHAAAETYLVTRLSFTLLRYLGYYVFLKLKFSVWFLRKRKGRET
jgi:prenylcysteine alpha-carboxyl methylesterase